MAKKATYAELQARVAELEKSLKEVTDTKNYYSREFIQKTDELDALHNVLDTQGIAGWKDPETKYYRIPLSARLFGWALSLKK